MVDFECRRRRDCEWGWALIEVLSLSAQAWQSVCPSSVARLPDADLPRQRPAAEVAVHVDNRYYRYGTKGESKIQPLARMWCGIGEKPPGTFCVSVRS